MLDPFAAWAARHPEAAAELRVLVLEPAAEAPAGIATEAGVLVSARLLASRAGWRVWRNNLGGHHDESGRFIRYGIANDSAAVNRMVKSGDLIGGRPVLIGPEHIGTTIMQFVSLEGKRPGWRFNPNNPREAAQMRWAELVNGMGGYAVFTTGGIER